MLYGVDKIVLRYDTIYSSVFIVYDFRFSHCKYIPDEWNRNSGRGNIPFQSHYFSNQQTVLERCVVAYRYYVF